MDTSNNIFGNIWNYNYCNRTKKLLVISPTMKFYKEWKDTPTHIMNRIYFFNFTNPADFERNGTKPIMKELGPYTFKEYQKKINITWNTNSTVTYRVHRVWYFQPDMSNGTLDDNITTISFVPVMTEQLFKGRSSFIQRAVSMALSGAGETLAITKTVNEYAFKGYDYSYSLIGTYLHPTLKKIGYFHTFNDSTLRDGVLNVDTGESDLKQNGRVKFWNYSPYQFEESLITGTTGELFSSELEKTNIVLFTPWLCRNLYFNYVGEEYVRGVRGYKFIFSERNIDNGSKYKENLVTWPEKIFPSGIMNLSFCYYDGQLIGSYPHFYMADQYFASQVEGMRPDPEKHQSYYIVEPISGVPLKARLFGQVNLIVRHNKNYRLYRNIPPDTFIPIFWIEKSFEIPSTIMEFLQTYLYLVEILEMTAIPSMIIGICIVSSAILWNNGASHWIILCYRVASLRRTKGSANQSRNSEMNKKYHFSKLPQHLQETRNHININTTEHL